MPIGTATKARSCAAGFPHPKAGDSERANKLACRLRHRAQLAGATAGSQDVPPFIVRGNVYVGSA
jgi:hypothetical protein